MSYTAQRQASDSAVSNARIRLQRGMLGAVWRMAAGPFDARLPRGGADNLSEMLRRQGRAMKALLRDMRSSREAARRSREEMVAARQQALAAQERIRELEQQLEQMGELVRADQLTGSLNRRGMEEAFARESARAARRGAPLCLALLDLDDFKHLNDVHGHAAGDAALAHLVRVARGTLRPMDVVCRFGGEEFVVLLPDTPMEHALRAMDRLRQELARRTLAHGADVLGLRFSGGVAQCGAGEALGAALERADAALYRAKRAGKDRVAVAA